MRKTVLIIFGVVVLAAAFAAAWYSYDRHAKIVHNDECSHTFSQPIGANPGSAVNVLPPCAYELVPPTLWDKLTGKQPPPLVPTSGCDQSATTSDCASIVLQNPPPQPEAPAVVNTTETIGNFTFGYPKGQGELSAFALEGVVFPGNYTLNLIGITNYTLFIFTTPSPLSSINPAAKSLDDYRTDYPLSATSTRQVHILSSENVTINGIPMLRQRYSVGEWSLDARGNRVFDSSSEADMTHELRYVFFDGKTFVVLTSSQADGSVDYVAQTIKLK